MILTAIEKRDRQILIEKDEAMIDFSGQLFFHFVDSPYLCFFSARERRDKQMQIEKDCVIHYSNQFFFNADNSPY